MKEKQFIIVGNNLQDDFLKMKILGVFKYSEYNNRAIPFWEKSKKKYKYCYILETIYG